MNTKTNKHYQYVFTEERTNIEKMRLWAEKNHLLEQKKRDCDEFEMNKMCYEMIIESKRNKIKLLKVELENKTVQFNKLHDECRNNRDSE